MQMGLFNILHQTVAREARHRLVRIAAVLCASFWGK